MKVKWIPGSHTLWNLPRWRWVRRNVYIINQIKATVVGIIWQIHHDDYFGVGFSVSIKCIASFSLCHNLSWKWAQVCFLIEFLRMIKILLATQTFLRTKNCGKNIEMKAVRGWIQSHAWYGIFILLMWADMPLFIYVLRPDQYGCNVFVREKKSWEKIQFL